MKTGIKEFITYEDGICLTWGVTDKDRLVFLHCGAEKYSEVKKIEQLRDDFLDQFTAVEIKANGMDCPPSERFPGQMVHSSLSELLKYESHDITKNEKGALIHFTLNSEVKAKVELFYQVYTGTNSFETYTKVTNLSDEALGLEEVSSFAYMGLEKDNVTPYEKQLAIHLLHNGWQKELAWQKYTPEQLGLALSQPNHRQNSSKVIGCSNIGNWSSKLYIPCVYIEKLYENETMCVQIQHNGSWQWQMGEHEGHIYIRACGPSEAVGAWYKELKKGDSFVSVPVGVTVSKGDASKVAVDVTKYRRAIRRVNNDDKDLKVIFNDYMNCLWGDPTTKKELPLIDAAAECGCEVFCIDCGWYDEGIWWDGVGEWLPCEKRFPEGLPNLLKKIRDKGMIPGLWLELEVVGVNSPLLKRVPMSWFFSRHGKPVKEKARYQLDFRNPEVIEFATGVIKRLVEEYGVGYIKMDYNIDMGVGTDLNADSAGDGLLEHNRAYLKWLDSIFEKYPDLIIENCSSGGMRIDYAMLSRYSVQSTSDMDDYRTYSTITVNTPLALTPEQSAVWSYPLMDGNPEETVNNMINTILLRDHQSGHLAVISKERKEIVKEGIEYYKKIRADRVEALPFWPLGFATYSTPWVALGLTGKEKSYLAVWRRETEENTQKIFLPQLRGKKINIAYPIKSVAISKASFEWDTNTGILLLDFPEKHMARLFEITD